MCHTEQSEYHACQSELRNFQRLFRIDAANDKTWPMIKNWQAWMGHMQSEFSHKLKQGMDTPQALGSSPESIFPLLALRPQVLPQHELHELQMQYE